MKIILEIEVELSADGRLLVFVGDSLVHEFSSEEVLNTMFEKLPYQEWLSYNDARIFAQEILDICDKACD